MSGISANRHRWNLLITVALTALCCSAVTLNRSPANAAVPLPSYRLDVCKDFNWMTMIGAVADNSVFSLSGECNWTNRPYEMTFAALSENDGTEEAAFAYPNHEERRPGLNLTRIRATMYGSDGSQNNAYQGLRICGSDCGELITLSQPSLPSPDDWEDRILETAGPLLPGDAYWVRFVGNCVTVPCGPTEPINFLRLEVDYSEVEPDSAPWTKVRKVDAPPATLPGSTIDFGWVNAPFSFRWYATDVGAGVSVVRWSAARGGNGTAYDHCDDSITNAYFCPLATSGLLTIDPTSSAIWQEGPQAVVIDAIDRVGLRASSRIQHDKRPASATFRIDRRAPTPESLSVVGMSSSGWVSSEDATLTWVNEGESTEDLGVINPASGVAAVRFDLDPVGEGQINPDPQVATGNEITSTAVKIPGPGRWIASVQTIDRAGNESTPISTVVGLDPESPGVPQLDPIGWIGSSYLIDGRKIKWEMPFGSKPPSGICGFGRSVDSSPDTDASTTPDIHGDVTSATLPDGMSEGTRYLHLRAISCAGKAGETVHQRFDVDLTPPSVSANHTDGRWVNGSDPLSLTADDDLSGIDSIHVAVDGSPTSRYPGSTVEPVLAEGRRSVTFQSYDVAGNKSLEDSVEIGVDRSTPDGRFDDVDPAKPTLIAVTAADVHSGIASAVVEYRSISAAAQWTPLTTRIDHTGNGAARLLARFPDASTADGVYDLRAKVVDAVGNSSLIVSRSDGSLAKIVTPVRSASVLDFGFERRRPTRCASKSKVRCKPKGSQTEKTVEFGHGATVVGRLKEKSGRPLVGVKVNLYTRRPGQQKPTDLAAVITGSDGSFRSTVPPGVIREVIARFPSSELVKPSEKTIKLYTRSKISISVKRRRIRSGQRIVIRGRLAKGGEKIGILGLPMYVHALGTSSTFRATVQSDGTYEVKTGRLAPPRPLRLRLQAELPQQPGWPYASGRSRVLSVIIVP